MVTKATSKEITPMGPPRFVPGGLFTPTKRENHASEANQS
jgi:hypothetical protein